MILRLLASALVLASAASQVLSQTTSQPAAQSPFGRAIAGRYIVTYRNDAVPAVTSTPGAHMLMRHPHLGSAVVATLNPAALLADPQIESVVQDRMVTAHALTVRAAADTTSAVDTFYHSQQGWAVRMVGGYGDAPGDTGPWAVTRGHGVRIAILDSGVDPLHPDIAPNLLLNMSEVDKTALPSACDDGSPADQQGHGTWTASLAAGAYGPGTGQVAGVAPEASLLNIKVLQRMPGNVTAADASGCASGQAAGLLSWVLQGIDDAVANRADVISLSLGTLVDVTTGDGAGLKATFDHATYAAFAAGTIVIAAAGNDGFDLSNPRYVELPAQARDVLVIQAATNPACAENLAGNAQCAAGPVTRPYYSNFGAPLNVPAGPSALAVPGGSYPAGPDADPTRPTGWIRGACSEGKPGTLLGPPADANHSMGCFGLGQSSYVQAIGTSAAAPLAAGVAALVRAAHPEWNAATVVAALRANASALPGLDVPVITALRLVKPADLTSAPVLSSPVVLQKP